MHYFFRYLFLLQIKSLIDYFGCPLVDNAGASSCQRFNKQVQPFCFLFFADFLKSKVEIDYFGSLIERCCGMFA